MKQVHPSLWMLTAIVTCIIPLTVMAGTGSSPPAGSPDAQGAIPGPKLDPPSGLRVQSSQGESGPADAPAYDPQAGGALDDKDEAIKTVQEASRVLMGVLGQAGTGIPPTEIQNAAALVVAPRLQEANVDRGHGTGVLVARNQDQWSLPVLITITGAGLDALSGAAATDLLMVFRNAARLHEVLQDGEFTLGDDGSTAAGHTGEGAAAGSLGADILLYQRTPEQFAGARPTGMNLSVAGGPTTAYYDLNEQTVRGYYGDERQMVEALLGIAEARQDMQIPRSAQNLQDILNLYASNALQ